MVSRTDNGQNIEILAFGGIKVFMYYYFMMKITKINCYMITDPSLLWKLHRNTIQNKANIWMTKDNWNFKTKGNFVYIENDSKKEVLGTTDDGKLILEDHVEDKPGQLWKRGEPDDEGYFVIQNSQSLKYITAISESSLEIRGKCILKYYSPKFCHVYS